MVETEIKLRDDEKYGFWAWEKTGSDPRKVHFCSFADAVALFERSTCADKMVVANTAYKSHFAPDGRKIKNHKVMKYTAGCCRGE